MNSFTSQYMRMLRSQSIYSLYTVSYSVLVHSASTKCQVANITLNLGLACLFCWLSAQHSAKSHRWCYEKFLLLSQSRQELLNFDDLNGIMFNKEMHATQNIFLLSLSVKDIISDYPVKALVTCLRIIWKSWLTIITERFAEALLSTKGALHAKPYSPCPPVTHRRGSDEEHRSFL